ncbi:MAG: ribokinase [Planctomycetota bacterium]|nr:ribokinase [Planctomycetota bacterium]
MNDSTVIVLGSINTDLVVRSAKLPAPGETVLGDEFYAVPGGKGANQAVAAGLANDERPVAFIAAVGDDEHGRNAMLGLSRANVRTDLISRIEGVPSGVALIMVNHAGENVISVASGANALLTPAMIAALDDGLFDSARVFLSCLESPLETVAAGLARAKSHALRTILNPAPASRDLIAAGVLKNVDLLTPNETELQVLVDRMVESDADTIVAARELMRHGCGGVIVTMGNRGALIVDRNNAEHIPAFEVEAIDSTAAGDVFNGVLAVELAAGHSLLDAARMASAAAAMSVTRRGAQSSIPNRQEMLAFLADRT